MEERWGRVKYRRKDGERRKYRRKVGEGGKYRRKEKRTVGVKERREKKRIRSKEKMHGGNGE